MTSKNPIASDEGVSDISTSGSEYEVFLNFRGSDTRDCFTDHLYIRLNDAGIRVFIDDEELIIGEKIGPELLKAINQSKIAIPIFSRGYAESKWCLKELVQIAECRRTTSLKVMPIFYDVTPTEVRNQTGKYGKAFEIHEKYYDQETITDWKRALKEVGELKGWDIHSRAHRKEGQLVKEVTNVVLHELKKAYLAVADDLIGLDHHVEEVLSTLTTKINGVCIVGIYGMGGIGKTTMGKVIYNNLLPGFENHCFLANMRETIQTKGMKFAQEKLIFDLSNKASTNISTIDEGIEIISQRFSRKQVLLLMDDVDEIIQLRYLMGKHDCFGCGSKIIITTRNKSILDWIDADRSYELCGLDFDQALQLFSRHAFRKDKPPYEYDSISRKIVERAGGLPLALEVFGSLLCSKSEEIWDFTIQKLEKVSHKEICRKLMISFEALDDQQKEIFLDIACFFIGEDTRIIVHFWDESEFPKEALEVLQQMSLIKIQDDHTLWMHDQLRDLGREIIRKEHMRPEKRSRLWNAKEATKLFMRKMGGDNVRGINLDFSDEMEYSISNEEFACLPNLKLLRVKWSHPQHQYRQLERIKASSLLKERPVVFLNLRCLSWHTFPDAFNVSNFSLEDLVILDLSYSSITSSWTGWKRVKMAKNLKVLNLTGCNRLVRTPEFSSHPKLEQLILEYCYELEKIDESINILEHLIVLNLNDCRKLRKLPKDISCTESLRKLDISWTGIVEIPRWPLMRRLKVFGCIGLQSLPKVNSLDFAANIIELDTRRSSITVLPNSIGNLVNLLKLSLQFCHINTLPESIGDLVSLIELDLSWSKIVELPQTIGKLKNLKVLRIWKTHISVLPNAIGMLENLTTLKVSLGLVNKPDLVSLEAIFEEMSGIPDLSSLINLKNLHFGTSKYGSCLFGEDNPALWWIGRLTNLETLRLDLHHVISLHLDMGIQCQLTKLEFESCFQLQSLPKLPPGLKELYIDSCWSLGSILDLPLSLASLQISDCKSLVTLDLSYLRRLSYLTITRTLVSELKGIFYCESLQELNIYDADLSKIDGIEMLENVTRLEIRNCKKLQRVLDLSSLKKLRELVVRSCSNLVEILGKLASLNVFQIEDCASLERIQDIPNSESLGDRFRLMNCGKLDKSLQQQSSHTQNPVPF